LGRTCLSMSKAWKVDRPCRQKASAQESACTTTSSERASLRTGGRYGMRHAARAWQCLISAQCALHCPSATGYTHAEPASRQLDRPRLARGSERLEARQFGPARRVPRSGNALPICAPRWTALVPAFIGSLIHKQPHPEEPRAQNYDAFAHQPR